jgi:hypothetical protein
MKPEALLSPVPTQWIDTWSGVATLYRDAMQASAQQLVLSSARIIQEQTVRAFVAASNACAEALAKNAMDVQQQSLLRFADAHQQAIGLMGQAWASGWTPNGKA